MVVGSTRMGQRSLAGRQWRPVERKEGYMKSGSQDLTICRGGAPFRRSILCQCRRLPEQQAHAAATSWKPSSQTVTAALRS
ncbi:hypothetical protein ABZP36_014904 [Zizania latifolia]